jgi:hypothetical protein
MSFVERFVEWDFCGIPANRLKRMVGTRRLELLTSTVSILYPM